MRVRVFIDFWNFTINWNQRTSNAKCDWQAVPSKLIQEAQRILAGQGLGSLYLDETRIYASYEPGRQEKLRTWLTNFLDKQPGVRVFQAERHWRKKAIHCRGCDKNVSQCPECGADLGRAAEKTIDSLIVTDLLSLAWEEAFDVALLLSSDRDFTPAVEKLQTKNKKVINATWKGHGHELARICWASFELDDIISKLVRS